MKKLLSAILASIILTTAFILPASADATTKITVKGKTEKSLNKVLYKEINELRTDMDTPKVKLDKALMSQAYKRAATLAVSYTYDQACVETEKFPETYVIAKGDDYDALDKVEKSMLDEDEELNACGIANLTVKNVTYWVVCFDTKTKITPYSSFKGRAKYKFTGKYYINRLQAANTGEFIDKSIRPNKKANGRFTLANGSVIKNTNKNYPVVYTSENPEIAKVNGYGKVTGKKPSDFRTKAYYTPKKGDFILFHWYKNDGWLANHIGIVYKVTGSRVYTVEGNATGQHFRKSKVAAKSYSRKSSDIVGYISNSSALGSAKAAKLANLAKKQVGKRGKNFYAGTLAWKAFLGGKYMADNWCAIFCGWLLEQNGINPSDMRWSPSCTTWIKQCHQKATARITAKIEGTDISYSYNVTVKI